MRRDSGKAVSMAIVLMMALSALMPLSGWNWVGKVSGGDEKGNSGVAKWTFIVYLDADNNLEGAGVEDLNEMESVGSTADVNIVVMMDRAEGEDTSNGDWTGAKRFYVVKDNDTSTIGSKELMDMGEVDMGDPNTLIDFATWAIDNYPAEHYFLDLWDHGGGFIGACWDDGDPNTDKDDDWLDLYNISYALSGIKEHLGRNIDVVGYDACLMGAISVYYAMMDYCDIGIGSGPTEPGDGWPYERILSALVDDPGMDPETLASVVVEAYVESYTDLENDPSDSPKVTLAAYRMDHMESVIEATEKLAMALSTIAGYPPSGNAIQLYAIRSATHSYDVAAFGGIDLAASYTMYDLYDLAAKILSDQLLRNDNVRSAAQELQRAIEAACVDVSVAHGELHPTMYGISVYFPTGQRDVPIPDLPVGPGSPYSHFYDNTQWAQDMFWDDFLKTYWDPHKSAVNTPPSVFVFNQSGGVLQVKKDWCYLEGVVIDLQGMPRVYVSIDDGDWVEVSDIRSKGGGEYEWRFNLPESGGSHEIRVKAIDSDGSESVVRELSAEIPSGEKKASGGVMENNTIMAIGILVVLIAILAIGYYLKRQRLLMRSSNDDNANEVGEVDDEGGEVGS